MEKDSPAEELPALYRAVLDLVARLEARGDRVEAARVRSTATRIYSRAWDERARRGLEDLLKRTEPGDPDPARSSRPVRRGSPVAP